MTGGYNFWLSRVAVAMAIRAVEGKINVVKLGRMFTSPALNQKPIKIIAAH